MRYCVLLICIVSVILLAANAVSEDSYLGEDSSNPDVKETMQSDIFNTSQSEIGTSVSAGTAKKTPVVISSSSKSSAFSSSPVQNAVARLAGSWHLDMADSIMRTVNISLSQSDDVVFGTGSMASGNIVQEVAAYGSIAGSKLNLDLLSMTDVNLYQLALDLKMPSVSGSYKAYSVNNVTWTGTAVGSVST